MDIAKVLKEYDGMFSVNTPDEIAGFLVERISEAASEDDKPALLTLLNEQIGFARDRGMRKDALLGCSMLIKLLDKMDLAGTIHYGKSLLNMANAYRVFGLNDSAESLFAETERLYFRILPEGDYEFAPLYNNWSLLAMSAGDTARACDLIKKSLDIVDRYEEAVINQATTRVNLGCALMASADGDDSVIQEAAGYIDEAVSMFESQGGDDFHFASALSAKGDHLMKKGSYNEAASCFRRAESIIRMYIGDNSKTDTLEKKIIAAENMAGSRNQQETEQ